MNQPQKSKVDWAVLGAALIKFVGLDLLKKAIEKVLINVIGASTGLQVWLVKVISTQLYKQIGEPLLKAGLAEIGYQIEVIENKQIVKRIKEAQSEQEYDDAIDDLLERD